MWLKRTMIAVLLFLVAIAAPAHAERSYNVGENLLRNPEWKNLDAHGIPEHWDRLVLQKGAQATVRVDGDGVLHIVFHGLEWADQARLRQMLTVQPGLVYELMYTYRSADTMALRADVSMVGTGPQYRNETNPPSKRWIRRRLLFHMPENVRDGGQMYLMFQNRSTVPIWYRDVSLRATDIKPDDLERHQPTISLHSVESEDVLIMPGTTAAYANFVVRATPETALKDLHLEARLYTADGKVHDVEYADGRIRVPMEYIPDGISKLYLYTFTEADPKKRVLVSYSRQSALNIERIAEDQIPSDIDFSRHVSFVNPRGEPFFPIGMYAGLGWDFSLKQLADAGFNTVHTYGTDSWKIREENFKLLQDAEKLGIWIMMGVPPRYMRDNQYLADLGEWVKAYRDYPAILFYYADETYTQKGTPPAVIKRAYEAVRKADPARGFYSYESPFEVLRGTMDGIMLNVSSPNVTKVVKLRMGDMPMFHVFGQRDHQGHVSPPLEAFHYEFVMPTIYGARGVFYWQLGAIRFSNPEGHLIGERLYQTSSRFARVAPAIVSDEPNPEWAEQIEVSGDMEHLVRSRDGKTYLLCGVHRDKKAGGLKIQFPSPRLVRDVLWAEELGVLDSVDVSLEGGAVRVLEVQSAD